MGDTWQILVSLATILLASVAIVISLLQTRQGRNAVRAQTFVSLLSFESQSSFQEGIQAISQLEDLRNYGTDEALERFNANTNEATRQDIYNTVVFLNYMAVLGEESYIKIQDGWDICFQAYWLCHAKLLPWWLDAQRRSHRMVFPSFQRACLVAGAITDEQITDFDKNLVKKYVKLYNGAAPQFNKEDLHKILSILS